MDEIEKLLKQMRSTHLTDVERAQMRASLVAFMKKHPANVSSWKIFLLRIMEIRLTLQLHPMVVALALVLCVGSGTSFAAERSLPGDALYAIKTNVNEKAIGVLAVSPSAKVEWSAELTDRRLSEAEKLLSEGRLTPLAVAHIQTGLAEATKAADSDSGDSDPDVADAQSDLQASLQGHVHVLSALETATSSDPSAVSQLLETVNSHAKGVAEFRTRAERAMTADTAFSGKLKSAASQKRKSAEDAVQTLRGLATAAKDSFGTSTSDDVSQGAAKAAERVTIGTKKLEDGDYRGAYGSYQAAIRAARETKISLDAAKQVRRSLKSRNSETSESPERHNIRAPKMTKMSAEPTADTAQPEAAAATFAAPDVANGTNAASTSQHHEDDSDDESIDVSIHF